MVSYKSLLIILAHPFLQIGKAMESQHTFTKTHFRLNIFFIYDTPLNAPRFEGSSSKLNSIVFDVFLFFFSL